ncbi:MAG TPA: ATP-dependent helicase HrpB [bacterium]|nr:ATP-dependent helicase HrpB [bacterium]
MRLDDLPVFPALPQITTALHVGPLVLSAETGAGKTSAIPAWLLSTRAVPGRVLVLEPRRLAAVSAASRVAELTGTAVGDVVGYRIRGDTRCGPRTVIEFVTEAIFIRMIQNDPLLSGVSLVVFDEFHERSATSDLGLAFAAEAREARPDLSILVMSATIETGRIASYMACPTITVPGRSFPVELRHVAPQAGERIEATTTRAIAQALAATEGDVLVFLPGLREIDDVASRLGSTPLVDIAMLHGGLDVSEQRAIVAPPPGARRRVVLSTNVAETSLTIPRVTAVVDAGLSRLVRCHAPSGLNRLVTERVSEAEAAQRSGRAGRVGPGLCLRCWSAADILPATRGPELNRIDLSAVVLECAARGALSMEALTWLDAPPVHAWKSAQATLRAIGLIDSSGAATRLGRDAVGLGLDPRAAVAMLRSAQGAGEKSAMPNMRAVALAVAMLSERPAGDSSGDLQQELERLARSRPADERIRRIRAEADRLVTRVRGEHSGDDCRDSKPMADSIQNIGDLLAAGFPDRLARRLDDGTWEFHTGRRARATLHAPETDWLVALDVDAGNPLGFIRLAASVSAQAAKSAMHPGARYALEVEWRGPRPVAFERNRFGIFALAEKRLDQVPAELLARAFDERLSSQGLDWLPWTDESRSLVDRMRFLIRSGVENQAIESGDWGDEALLTRLRMAAPDWLSASGPALDERALVGLVESMLAPLSRGRLETLVPESITTPGGRTRRPVYPADGPARLSGRIQEFFGMRQGPTACGSPITLELLSPADRPLQVTSDLESFWRITYPSIRNELARRYPRHSWPLDPLIAAPMKGPKPR